MRLYILIFTLIGNYFSSNAQKWMSDSTVINYYYYDRVAFEANIYARVQGDTIIGNHVCQIIRTNLLINPPGTRFLYYTYKSGDTIYMTNDGVFYPIFKMGMQVGDTLIIARPNTGGCIPSVRNYKFRLISKDSIQSIQRNEYTFELFDSLPDRWYQHRIKFVEGIGYDQMPYPSFNECIIDGWDIWLCGFQADSISYSTGAAFCGTLGLENSISSTSFLIYPNPISNSIRIRYNESQRINNTSIKFYDLVGRELFSTEIQDTETQIDVSNWQRGVYLYSIAKDEVSQQKGKIVLE